MIDTKNTSKKTTKELTQQLITTANIFGFSDLNLILSKIPNKKTGTKNKLDHINKRDKNFIKLMQKIASKNLDMIDKHILGYTILPNKDNNTFSLNISGSDDPIAEAVIIATTYSMLNDVGIKGATVHINSIGNNESYSRYVKQLTKYINKILKNTDIKLSKNILSSPLKIYAKLYKIDKDLVNSSPNPIDFLNDSARTHLLELLELLESAKIPYIINNSIIGNSDFFEHTIFEIKTKDEKNIAYGGRYTPIGRKLFNKQIPTVGINIDIKKNKLNTSNKRHPKTTVYFAQISKEAKKLGLNVLTMLNNAGIKVEHMFTHNEMSKQMTHSDIKKMKHIIIIGHKEAIDNTIIIRDVLTNKQKVIPKNKLIGYLKRLQK